MGVPKRCTAIGNAALVADNEIDRLGQGGTTGMILVPRIPTKEMIEAAYYDAMAEDAAGVWRSMVEAWLQTSTGNSDSGNG
jgi:hypothetical protein